MFFGLPEKTGLAHLAWSLLCACPELAYLPGAGGPLVCGAVPTGSVPTTHRAPPLPAALCFALTRSLLLTCLVPAGLLGLRYYYSRKVVLAYLDCALHTDMADIEQYYMKPPGESRGSLDSSSPLPPPALPAGRAAPSAATSGQAWGRGWAQVSLGWGTPVTRGFWVPKGSGRRLAGAGVGRTRPSALSMAGLPRAGL